eukprot:scaffold28385_cov27-Tisochrysis_lutea.AAC.1
MSLYHARTPSASSGAAATAATREGGAVSLCGGSGFFARASGLNPTAGTSVGFLGVRADLSLVAVLPLPPLLLLAGAQELELEEETGPSSPASS